MTEKTKTILKMGVDINAREITLTITADEAREILSALSEQNKGKWIKTQSGDKDFPESIVCSRCKEENSYLEFDEHHEPIHKTFIKSKFCPNCGADMRGKSCSTCKNNDDEFSGECYECLKGIFDHYEPEEVKPNE